MESKTIIRDHAKISDKFFSRKGTGECEAKFFEQFKMQRNNSNGETSHVARKSTKVENKTDRCEYHYNDEFEL